MGACHTIWYMGGSHVGQLPNCIYNETMTMTDNDGTTTQISHSRSLRDACSLKNIANFPHQSEADNKKKRERFESKFNLPNTKAAWHWTLLKHCQKHEPRKFKEILKSQFAKFEFVTKLRQMLRRFKFQTHFILKVLLVLASSLLTFSTSVTKQLQICFLFASGLSGAKCFLNDLEGRNIFHGLLTQSWCVTDTIVLVVFCESNNSFVILFDACGHCLETGWSNTG